MKASFARNAALCSALFFVPTVPVLAQTDAAPVPQSDAPPPPQGGHRGGGVEHRVEMLRRSLDLSAEQTTQVRSLLEGERSKMDALRANTALSPEDRHTQGMAIHTDTSARMHALLTADQATKYDALEAHMREHRPGNGEAPPPPSGGPGQQ